MKRKLKKRKSQMMMKKKMKGTKRMKLRKNLW
jgi:hypothetical protein